MAAGYWDKITAQRVSRRRVLQSAGVAGAAAGAVWLVGCGGGSSNKTPSAGGTSGATAAKGTPKKVGPNPLGVPERALDASDIVESYARVLTLKDSNAYGFLGKWMHSQTASPDNKTYTFKTPKPYAYFQNRIGSPINTIVPKEALSDVNVEKLKQQAAGAGAFILKSYTEGQGAELARNPNYYRKDTNNNNAALPYIDGLSGKIITAQA